MYILFPGGLFENRNYRSRVAPNGFESILDGFNRNMESLYGSHSEPDVKNIINLHKPMDTWRITTKEDMGEDEMDKKEDDIDNLPSNDDLWNIFFSEYNNEEEPKKEHKFVPIEPSEPIEPTEPIEPIDRDEDEDEDEDEHPPYDLMDRKEVPESIFDHIEDFFPPKMDDANSVPKMNENKNPFVFIANRLTFIIKTKQPIIFNTSMIESTDNYMDIAIDEKKTFPKLHNVNDVGIITNELNHDEELLSEIKEYLDGTEWKSIFCFPIIMNHGKENETLAIRFVVTK